MQPIKALHALKAFIMHSLICLPVLSTEVSILHSTLPCSLWPPDKLELSFPMRHFFRVVNCAEFLNGRSYISKQ